MNDLEARHLLRQQGQVIQLDGVIAPHQHKLWQPTNASGSQ